MLHGQSSIASQTMLLMVSSLGTLLDLEKTTFDIMWDLSKPGSDADEPFLRVPQTLYYRDETEKVEVFEKMPNVSSSLRFILSELLDRVVMPFNV